MSNVRGESDSLGEVDTGRSALGSADAALLDSFQHRRGFDSAREDRLLRRPEEGRRAGATGAVTPSCTSIWVG